MLTAAIRDLHATYPRQFLTDVRTDHPELWENNPYVTHLRENAPEIETVDCHYPLIHKSNTLPYHFIHAFIQFLNERLDLRICVSAFKGDIHLSTLEKSADMPFKAEIGSVPFWLLIAGGKYDFTIKWWDHARFQQIVDYFNGKIRFVQVGLKEHYHPSLRGVVDLRGKTSLRQLINLVHHSQGILCPVSLPMHLAAAVETRNPLVPLRPCVVIAGGREPPHWEAYPSHQFIHTVGSLPCCANGGCWQSRVLPLGDGDEKDSVYNRCHFVVGRLPKCMDMISSQDVIRRIEFYFDGTALQYV